MKEHILVLDFGTGAARCNLFDLHGQLVYSSYRELQYNLPYAGDPEIREFNAGRFWHIFAGLIQDFLSNSGISREEIIGVTSTSQREGIVLLDGNGREVYAAPNLDFRGRDEALMLKQDHGQDIYLRTGHWPHEIFALARLLWLQKHQADVYQKIKTLLLLNDWLLFKLCGEKACEPSNASETLLFNLHHLNWDRELIARFGLPPDIFPPVRQIGEVIGAVTQGVAKLTGLKAGTPVCLGGADTQCAVLGAGGCEQGRIVAVCGTSTPVQSVVSRPIIDRLARIWTGCHVVPGKWVLDSNVRPTGVVYRWLRDTFYTPGGSGYAEMNAEAAQVPIGSKGVMSFLGPGISNVKDQVFYPGTVMGLKPGYEKNLAERGLLTRSLLENICYGIKGNVKQLEEIAAREYQTIYVTGGGIKGKVFLEILTNVLHKPVQTTYNSEATSLGAAIGTAFGLKYFSGFQEACNAMVHYGPAYTPDEQSAALYGELYNKWRATDALLIDLCKLLGTFPEQV